MTLLRELGVDPDTEQVHETIGLVCGQCRWEHATLHPHVPADEAAALA